MKLNVLIVDDEILSSNRVRRLLRGDEDIGNVRSAADGEEAVVAIREERPDLIFLDVQMPGVDGFELLEQIRRGCEPYIIFITAYEDYAVQAFDVHALDYLLKPFSRQRFEIAMTRAKQAIRQASATPTSPNGSQRPGYSERLIIKDGGEVFLLKTSSVQWIKAEGRYVSLHLEKGTVLKREGINTVEARLDPKRFLRVHRSYIVNIDAILKLEPWFHGDYRITLHDGTRLPLARSYKTRIQEVLGDHLQ